MRIIFIFLLLISGVASAQENVQVSPLFQRVAGQAGNKMYDTKAWSFYTGSSVRATPFVKGPNVYFGNAQGDFFAIDKKTGMMKWKYHTGEAIHSSATGAGGKLFFADNKQTVYALNESNGKLVWSFEMSRKQDYPWRFDYYYSSPVLHNDKLMIGGDDGFFYALNPGTGKLIWKFKCKGIVRSTAAVYKNTVFFGDTEASLYALNIKTGKEQWQYKINGDTMRNENFGFDRRAINSSPVIAGNKLIFGGRDGFLYCINADDGTNLWKMDHHVSWVISTVAIKDSFVVTGTSDGRFVQAVNIETGKEIWRRRTLAAVWASPLIAGDKVYAGDFDGQLDCIDLKTGKRVSRFKTNDKILSSPVWNDQLLYVGSDDGCMYALSGHEDKRQYKDELRKYVYYENGINVYFNNNSDKVIRDYLRANGFKGINSDSLIDLLSKESTAPAAIVFASSYFPAAIIKNGKNSLLRKFLDHGGRVVLTGINPVVYKIDEETKQPVGFNRHAADTILGLDYGEGDTRSFMGSFPCFPTQSGKQLGLPDFWTTSLFIDEKNVDLVLGKNENGKVSAFVKNYSNGGQLVQVWINADRPERLDAVIKVAEWPLE